MKIWELSSGLNVMLSDEENNLLTDLINNSKKLLTDREEIVAQSMVAKNILSKVENKNKVVYLVNYSPDVWRD